MQCHQLLLGLLLVTLVTSLEVGEDYAIRSEDQEWLNSLFYIPSTPRVRREYRMLSEEERNVFHNAFVKMKRDRSVKPNKFDLLASLHARRSVRNSAHRGTGFLAWHRVYLLLFENGLREQEVNITMPYWDCTLESALELPRESSLFSEDFMGNGDGYVTKGVFKDWGVQSGRLYRTVGALHRPLGDRNISHMLEQRHLANISYPLYSKDIENVFELIHNRVHHWIGGEMKAIETAADDPIFQPYHSFVSYVWEEFRTKQKQQGIDPETDWSEFYGQGRHHKYSPMGLGNLMAIDGASEVFAENIVFEKRPTCSRENVDCDTPYLYCNVTLDKCVPWTIKEYALIKSKANETNQQFKDVADPYLGSKIKKGYQLLISSGIAKEKLPNTAKIYLKDKVEDLFKVLEETQIVYENKPDDVTIFDVNSNIFGDSSDNHVHGHSHDQVSGQNKEDNHDHIVIGETVDNYSENVEDLFSHGGHMHGDGGDMHESTRHEQKIIDKVRVIKREKYPIEEFLDKYGLLLFAGLIIFRAGFALIMKCSNAKCCSSGCSSKRQLYHIDGIVNVNFDEDMNKGPDVDTSRTDNIYTVTVTASSQDEEMNGTFVRFAKLETLRRNRALNDGSQEADDRLSNYLDMTYASYYAQQPEQGELPTISDVYEQEPNEKDEEECVDDNDASYNSIENENFDFIRAAITEAGESVSESEGSDLFDTYDNVMNVAYARETPAPYERGKPTPSPRIRRDQDKKLEHEDGYIQYMPGTHM